MITTYADKIQPPVSDFAGSFAGGLKIRAAMDEMRRSREAESALPSLIDAYSSGDKGALARIAMYNPQLATGLAQAAENEAQAAAAEQKAHYERFQQEGSFLSDSLRALNAVPPEQRGDVYESIQEMAERAGIDMPPELLGRWDENKHARIGALAKMYARSATPFQGQSMEAQIANLAYSQALAQGVDPDTAKLMAVNTAASRTRSVMNELGEVNYITDAPVFRGVGGLGAAGVSVPAAAPFVPSPSPASSSGALSSYRAPAAVDAMPDLPPMETGADIGAQLDVAVPDNVAPSLPIEIAGDALPPADDGTYDALPAYDLPSVPADMFNRPFARKKLTEEAIARNSEIDKEQRALAREREKEGRDLKGYEAKKKIDVKYEQDKIKREEKQKTEEAKNRDFSNTSDLRNQFISNSKDFILRRDAVGLIESMFSKDAEKAIPMNDISLIIAYNKLLDPGAVVREADFTTVENARAKISDAKVFDLARTYIEGGKLTNKQRSEIRNISRSLYDTAKAQQEKTKSEYRRLAKTYGFDPDKVVIDLDLAEKNGESGKKDLKSLSDDQLLKLLDE